MAVSLVVVKAGLLVASRVEGKAGQRVAEMVVCLIASMVESLVDD